MLLSDEMLLPPRPGRTRVFVMRHGQSTYNAEGRFQGCCNEPALTEAGIAAAEAAGRYLLGAHLQTIITSPLRRAAHTALRIYGRVWNGPSGGPGFRLDPQLREIELPLWEGIPIDSVRREFENHYRVWKEQPHLFRMPEDRTPVAELFTRAERFWSGLLRRNTGETVLLVTHGGTGRALIGTAIGLPIERFHAIQQSNGGINLLEFGHESRSSVRLLAVNATDYIGQELPKVKEAKTGWRILLLPAGACDHVQSKALAQMFENVRIHAAFGDSAGNREVAAQLVRHHGLQPGTATAVSDFGVFPESLKNVLWVAGERLVRRTLADALGLQPDRGVLSAIPFTISVLHLAGPGKPPVLQALNLYDTARLSRSIVPVP